MKTNLFERLNVSNEACKKKPGIKKSTEEEFEDICDIVTVDNSYSDLKELEYSLTKDDEILTKSMSIVNDLEQTLTDNESKLEQPMTITTVDTIISQEHLKITGKLLGVDIDTISKHKLSIENMSLSPVSGFTLSTESLKTVILTIIEKIKELFKSIVINIKKLYVKIIVILNNSKKTASELKQSILNNDTPMLDKTMFSNSDANRITNKLSMIMAIAGDNSGLVKEPAEAVLHYLKLINDPVIVKDLQRLLSVTGDLVINNINKNTLDAKVSTDINTHISRYIDSVLDSNPIYIKIGKLIENSADYQKIGNNHILPVRVYGNNLDCVILKSIEENNANNKSNFPTLTKLSIPLSKYIKKQLTYQLPAKEEIITILDYIITHTLDAKKYSEYANVAVDTSVKFLNTSTAVVNKSENVTNETKVAINRFSNLCKTAVMDIALTSVLTQVYGTKAVLLYCATASKYYKR